MGRYPKWVKKIKEKEKKKREIPVEIKGPEKGPYYLYYSTTKWDKKEKKQKKISKYIGR